MSRKRPTGQVAGRLVHSGRQESSSVSTSAPSGNVPPPTISATHLAPSPLTHIPHGAAGGLSTDLLSGSGAPAFSAQGGSWGSAAPNIPASSSNLASSSSGPSAKKTKHKVVTGLKTGFRTISRAAEALGTRLGMSELGECLDMIDSALGAREEYRSLKTNLQSLLQTLIEQFAGPGPQMSPSIKSLLNGIRKEVEYVNKKCNRGEMRRHQEAIGDSEDIMNCYRRIQWLLSQISVNANMEAWKIVDTQLAETRLRGMSISKVARYNSAESTGLLRGKCTPNTRRKVIGGLHVWVDDPNSINIYWLNGMAGTGKTTIAYSFCAEREAVHSLGASFFCSRSSASCNDATMIVPTIAYQLALFSYPFRAMICELLGNELDICERDVATQFQQMIVNTLAKTYDSVPRNTVVVIDALDECSNQQDVRILLETLFQHAAQLPIKFLLSSRAEGAIHPQMMRNLALRSVFYLHEVEESFVREDIELYVKAELDPISPSSDRISQLVQQAGRLFIYAATVIRYVKRDGFDDYSLDRLDSLLQLDENNDDIDDLYTRILLSAFNKPRLSEQENLDMLEVLHTVICAREPLTIDALGVLLRPNRPKVVRTALLPFYSVLHVSQISGLVTVLHASFPDYLLSQQRAGRFYCDIHQQNRQLVRLCFNRISNVNPPFNICALESSYLLDSEVLDLPERIERTIPSELFYACRHWLAHVEMTDDSEELKILVANFLSSHLLLWMEVMNLRKCMSVGAQMLSYTQKWCQMRCHDHMLMDLAKDAHAFATMFASNPASLSTPHIYISMLALWSPTAPVSVHYRKRMRGLVEASTSSLSSGNSPLLARWSTKYKINDLAISPDGTRFVITHERGISIWDTYTGKVVLEPSHGQNELLSVSYSPDGTRVVAGSSEGTICVWEAHNGQVALGPLEGHTRGASSVAYSPDGTRIVSGSYDKSIRVRDASTGRVICLLLGHSDVVLSVAYSPDGTSIASGGADGTILIWDLLADHAHLLHKPPTHKRFSISFVVYSPNGGHIASVAGSELFVRGAHVGQNSHETLKFGYDAGSRVAYSPDGTRICSCQHSSGAINIWDTHRGGKVAGPLFGHGAAPVPVARYPLRIDSAPLTTSRVIALKPLSFSAVAKYLPDGSRIISTFSEDSSICIWDARIAEEHSSLTEGHVERASSFSWSLDGTQIFSGSDNGVLCIWDACTGRRVLGPLKEHKHGVLTVVPSADGSRIFSVSADGTLLAWDLSTNNKRLGLVNGFSHVLATACSPDGSPLIVSGYRGPIIRVWDTVLRKLVLEMAENRFESIDLVACSSNGAYIASSCYRTIHIWDVSNRRIAWSLRQPNDLVQSIAYSPDGDYIVSGSSDMTIHIWNARDGQMKVGPIRGHAASVDAIAYSPDGTHIASGSQDGTIYIWNARNGDMVAGPFSAPNASIKSIAYSPDNARIAAASDDGGIRVWYPGQQLTEGMKLNEEGWVVNSLSQRLVWVPHDRRGNFLVDGGVRICTGTSFSVNLNGACLGCSWVDICTVS